VSVLRQLRALVLGETWSIPIGVAMLIAAGALARHLWPEAWRDAGGPLLAAGVVLVLVVVVARSAPPLRRRQP